MVLREHIESKVSIGSTGNPALRCADCELIIEDDVLDESPDYLEMIAQNHRCDEAEQAAYLLARETYYANREATHGSW